MSTVQGMQKWCIQSSRYNCLTQILTRSQFQCPHSPQPNPNPNTKNRSNPNPNPVPASTSDDGRRNDRTLQDKCDITIMCCTPVHTTIDNNQPFKQAWPHGQHYVYHTYAIQGRNAPRLRALFLSETQARAGARTTPQGQRRV